jgi:hypothetical protein
MKVMQGWSGDVVPRMWGGRTLTEKGRCEKTVRLAPEHAVRLGNGILLGGDRGEWGGELVFRDSNGKDKTLLNENVVSVKVIEQNAYVFTGLSHLGSSFGAMYVVNSSSDPDGLKPRLLLKLDAPPTDVSFDENSAFRLRFGGAETSTSDGMGDANKAKYRCFSFQGGQEPIELACDEPRP